MLLDANLATLYGVPTGALVQAVKRNLERFPEDFMFQLTAGEWAALRSQFVISNAQRDIQDTHQFPCLKHDDGRHSWRSSPRTARGFARGRQPARSHLAI